MSDFAVLTGDLIASSELAAADLRAAMKALEDGAKSVEGWLESDTYFTQSRGDGWQMYIVDARYALRAALVMKASLRANRRGLSTRIAIAAGREGRPDSPNLNIANGRAFVESGMLLDRMAKSVTLEHSRKGATGAAARLADAISRRWTQKQASALALSLAPSRPSNVEVASLLGVSRQAVGQSLGSANYKPVHEALILLES